MCGPEEAKKKKKEKKTTTRLKIINQNFLDQSCQVTLSLKGLSN